MKIIYLLIFTCSIFLITPNLLAQPNLEWVRTYHGPLNGGDVKVLTVDKDNNIIISCKSASSAIAYDIATLKYTPAGDTMWVRRFSSGGECSVDGIASDGAGNIYVTGFSNPTGQPQSITIKYSPTGQVLWEKLYNSSPDNRSVGVGIDNSGFAYIAGNSNKDGIDWGFEAVKYNPLNGDTIWTARYDYAPNSIDIAYGMTVDGLGNVYICGYSNTDSIRSVVVKINSQGVIQWASSYKVPDISGYINGYKIKTDSNGNVYIAGQAYNGQATFVDFFVAKYYPNGEEAWVQRYSNSNSTDEAYDLAIDNSGNVFATGKSYAGGGGSNNYDYLTVKFSPNGNVLWQATYNGPTGPTQDEAVGIVLDQYGDCYITGGSSSTPMFYSGQFATVKYNGINGNEIWSVRHASGDFGGTCLGIDTQNNIYVAGSIIAEMALIKYSQPPVPVELTSFTAEGKGSMIELSWKTSTETNNKGFELQRRKLDATNTANSDWQNIIFIAGSGTTTEPQTYSYKDIKLTPGKYHYRLKQTDFDGAFQYSSEIESEAVVVGEFSLKQNYPNPFNPTTVIQYTVGVKQNVLLKIYNIQGEEIITLVNEEKEAGNYELKFNGSQLSSGIYFYKLTTGSFTETRKMALLR